jgi:hypothetical protein
MSDSISDMIIIEPGKHSSRGASSADRWLNCAGQINLTEKLAKEGKIGSGSSRAAAEGTAAHLVLAACLEDGSDASSMADVTIKADDWSFIVDKEMIEGVQECLDWVRTRIARAESEGFEVNLYIEKSMTSIFDEDVYGTADILIHILNDRLIVVDFKYGKGVSVEPTSTQNAYYGYLGVENYVEDPSSLGVVESWIAQPRIPHPSGTIRRHVTNCEELTKWWLEVVIPGIARTRDPNAPLTIGEHCRFCPNKGHCPALKNEVVEFPMGIDVGHLDNDELGDMMTKIEAIMMVQSTLEAEALRRARLGDTVRGYKLVRKKANRQFKASMALPDPDDADKRIEVKLEDAVMAQFGLDAYNEPKMRSPNQIEALEGGKVFASTWGYTPDNGETLAKNSDKRVEVRPNIERVRGTSGS